MEQIDLLRIVCRLNFDTIVAPQSDTLILNKSVSSPSN